MRTWVLVAGILIAVLGFGQLYGYLYPSDTQAADPTMTLVLIGVGAVLVVVSFFLPKK